MCGLTSQIILFKDEFVIMIAGAHLPRVPLGNAAVTSLLIIYGSLLFEYLASRHPYDVILCRGHAVAEHVARIAFCILVLTILVIARMENSTGSKTYDDPVEPIHSIPIYLSGVALPVDEVLLKYATLCQKVCILKQLYLLLPQPPPIKLHILEMIILHAP